MSWEDDGGSSTNGGGECIVARVYSAYIQYCERGVANGSISESHREETIEERLLVPLSSKHDLALAALDVDSDVLEVEMSNSMVELRQRLERLLVKPPPTPIDASQLPA